jgi:conjugative transfer signal peptidase TraF
MKGFLLLQIVLWPNLIAFTAGAYGVRLNVTGSVPIGLYLVSSAPQASFAEFCPPEPFASLSVARGYRRRSIACPDGGEPLLKPIIATEGDSVEVSARGILVNNSRIPNTQQQLEDSRHRPLPVWPHGLYRVASGTVWVVSSYNPRSFDSRYFGPVQLKDVKKRLRALWAVE